MCLELTIRTLPAGLLAIAALACASSASAQAEVASAQISGEVHKLAEGKVSPLGQGDEEFQRLFASWQSLDNGSGTPAPVSLAVSVPSHVPLDALRMTSGYGMRNHPILRKRRRHKGVDLAAPRGTPIYAAADGVISKAERWGSYGNYIQIEHGGEMHTRYAHLSGYAVAFGDRVRKGDLIGYVGSTGRSTGPHLHYEVRIADEAVDPIPYMAAEAVAEEISPTEAETAMGGPE